MSCWITVTCHFIFILFHLHLKSGTRFISKIENPYKAERQMISHIYISSHRDVYGIAYLLLCTFKWNTFKIKRKEIEKRETFFLPLSLKSLSTYSFWFPTWDFTMHRFSDWNSSYIISPHFCTELFVCSFTLLFALFNFSQKNVRNKELIHRSFHFTVCKRVCLMKKTCKALASFR